ncbi:hypothetical protein QQ054_27235 [Oscillatoria amoena NRMC-F 0135]|nr:hypothetical protein [Oscillatoria amoena NRMC-F 0135]
MQIAQNTVIPVGGQEAILDHMRTGNVQQVFGNGFAFMIQEGIRLGAEQFSDGVDHGCTLPQSPFFEKRISSKKFMAEYL